MLRESITENTKFYLGIRSRQIFMLKYTFKFLGRWNGMETRSTCSLGSKYFIISLYLLSGMRLLSS